MNNRCRNVGGQAVIEGVMMRNGSLIATAVRRPNGEIVYKRTNLSLKRKKLSEIPFVRGVVTLFDSLVIGMKELTFSANQSEENKEEQLTNKEAVLTTSLSLALGIGLFIVLPSIISSFLFQENKGYVNLCEGILRLVFFLLYIWGISFSDDIKRVFEYHGAEHKTIYAYENDLELTPENAKKFTTLHPRCGTSFLLTVMLIAIIVFSSIDYILPTPETLYMKILLRVFLRILLMPLIAGLSYEFQRFSSKHLDNFFIRMLAMPGMALQKITTKEPSVEQLEVAIVAMKISLGQEVENAIEIDK
ncbi:MAG: DUF1385 domain-containing protein [Fusobacterium perfoetens]|uniref:DUF1385 domain-containing protein n=1 Tax=Fusobacterium perfoetens TaxID=852 RepID=UPI0023F147D9|nr:DUF1385 domain-containing protein [Fusobacterium perfoetens]MCI6152702.1 DUF1385 domain-containing protein [Fusobacterium perfoetens]MDY3236596.1 DUF1385 domain-containing protein [Fusobacterium perfoetens]